MKCENDALIVGRCLSVRSIAVALVMLYAAALPAHAQRSAEVRRWNLATLMATMHQVNGSTARFVETRYLHLLNQPQHSSGRLIYTAPDRLQKETIEPAASRMTIVGQRLTIERPGQPVREMSLQDNSAIGALVESIRATLAGDQATLTRYFTIMFDGGPDNWVLGLVPTEPGMRALVTTIRIQGQQASIREIDTTQADGDRIDTIITPDTK
jgi:outer membrane lipoprotein-sorting protein